MKPISITTILITLLQSGCMVFGIRSVKEPRYDVLEKLDNKEIRSYRAYMLVSSEEEGSMEAGSTKNFRRLFKYISGENNAKEKVEMTAPVIQETVSEKIEMTAPVFQVQKSDKWQMSFVLPERYDQDNAPIPNDPKLTLSLVEPKIVGVLRYTGSTNEKKMVPLAKELHDWLLEMGYSPTSPFRSARYDPPFSLPFLRRNEIHFDVKKSDKAE